MTWDGTVPPRWATYPFERVKPKHDASKQTQDDQIAPIRQNFVRHGGVRRPRNTSKDWTVADGIAAIGENAGGPAGGRGRLASMWMRHRPSRRWTGHRGVSLGSVEWMARQAVAAMAMRVNAGLEPP